MSGPVKALVYGLADPRQALEAGRLGIDGAIVAVGDDAPPCVSAAHAAQVARQLPPLAARLACLAPGTPPPPGFTGVVAGPGTPRGSGIHVVQHELAGPPPADADAVWITPPPGASPATWDFGAVERLGRVLPVLLEVSETGTALETAIRLARPYAIVLGAAVWFQPGFIDIDRLEDALRVVAKLNKIALGM